MVLKLEYFINNSFHNFKILIKLFVLLNNADDVCMLATNLVNMQIEVIAIHLWHNNFKIKKQCNETRNKESLIQSGVETADFTRSYPIIALVNKSVHACTMHD